MIYIPRRTSRVLLVDNADRLLLLCARDPRAPGARWWFTVGGGLEDAEDYPEAAVREIREETGLALDTARLGPPVWTRQTLFTVDGHGYDQFEEYRLARITATESAALRIDPEEAQHGHHWWTLAELAETQETVRPRQMAELLPAVLAAADAAPRTTTPLHLGDFNEDAEPDHPGRASGTRRN